MDVPRATLHDTDRLGGGGVTQCAWGSDRVPSGLPTSRRVATRTVSPVPGVYDVGETRTVRRTFEGAPWTVPTGPEKGCGVSRVPTRVAWGSTQQGEWYTDRTGTKRSGLLFTSSLYSGALSRRT